MVSRNGLQKKSNIYICMCIWCKYPALIVLHDCGQQIIKKKTTTTTTSKRVLLNTHTHTHTHAKDGRYLCLHQCHYLHLFFLLPRKRLRLNWVQLVRYDVIPMLSSRNLNRRVSDKTGSTGGIPLYIFLAIAQVFAVYHHSTCIPLFA
jgi:hypothetical protein